MKMLKRDITVIETYEYLNRDEQVTHEFTMKLHGWKVLVSTFQCTFPEENIWFIQTDFVKTETQGAEEY
jgi:hypothetical protein